MWITFIYLIILILYFKSINCDDPSVLFAGSYKRELEVFNGAFKLFNTTRELQNNPKFDKYSNKKIYNINF